MQTSFDEAARALKLRFPWWADGRIEVSFDDKYTKKDGGSGGSTFGVLLLSLLQGYEIDPAFAMTGDISVDWKVQKVGGVPWKILGAVAGNCRYVAIPKANAGDVNDLRLLQGDASLWSAQIFSIATLQDAVALARTDRAAPVTEAMKDFADLVPQLGKSEKVALASADVQKALEHIVALAPNHLSAALLLQVANRTAPATLSEEATLERLQIIRYPYIQLLGSNRKIDRVSLPAVVTISSQKKINALRAIADKKFLPFLSEYGKYAQFIDDIAAGRATAANAKERTEAIATQFAALRQQ